MKLEQDRNDGWCLSPSCEGIHKLFGSHRSFDVRSGSKKVIWPDQMIVMNKARATVLAAKNMWSAREVRWGKLWSVLVVISAVGKPSQIRARASLRSTKVMRQQRRRGAVTSSVIDRELRKTPTRRLAKFEPHQFMVKGRHVVGLSRAAHL